MKKWFVPPVFVFAVILALGLWPTPAHATVTKRALVFNTAASANTDLCGADFTVARTGVETSALRITVCLESTDSVVNVQVNQGGTAKLMHLNNGTAITAGNVCTFTLGVSSSCTYNVQCVTSTTCLYLLVEEVSGDVL